MQKYNYSFAVKKRIHPKNILLLIRALTKSTGLFLVLCCTLTNRDVILGEDHNTSDKYTCLDACKVISWSADMAQLSQEQWIHKVNKQILTSSAWGSLFKKNLKTSLSVSQTEHWS